MFPFLLCIWLGTKKNKLACADANQSRFATKIRYVVEARNSHIKNKWKALNGAQIYQSIPNLKIDFRVCSALVNAFCREIESDRNDWNKIGDLMLSNMNESNILGQIAHRIPTESIQLTQNLTLYPKLTYHDLKEISQGSYQIKLAKSYCQLHIKANQNSFPIYVCSDVDICDKYFANKIVLGPNPILLWINLRSRFESQKSHKTYVLLDFCAGKYVVKAYCCSCRHGCRTVGCCGHVMLVIWYTLHIDQNNLQLPSSNFDHIFGNWNNLIVEPEASDPEDTESSSEDVSHTSDSDSSED